MSTGIGIIGTGWGARVQVPAFRAAGLDVVALAGRQEHKTRETASQLAVPFATDDWRALVAHDDVALVSIVTPPVLHRDMAIAVLEAGKHVLCEKPTAMHAEEARQMLEAARAHPGQFALIDHELRFLPAFQQAREVIRSGQIGAPRHADLRFVSTSRANPQRPWTWWNDASQGGGVLGAISSHQIDVLRFLLDDEVQIARGMVRTFIEERPTEEGDSTRPVTADDLTSFHLQFRGGVVATVTANMVGQIEEPHSMTIYGELGTLRLAQGRLMLAGEDGIWYDQTPPDTIEAPGSGGRYNEFERGTVYLGQALKLALAGDTNALRIAATFEDGLFIQQTLDAVRQGL